MERRPLGRTGIDVCAVCLGTMTFGQQNTEAEGFAQMDAALEAGVDFFDTAEIYPIPPKAETQGATETIIGNWMAQRGNRGAITLATKVAGRSQNTYLRGEPARLHARHIRAAVEGSLTRLRTDYIDIYQTHWPDRQVPLFGSGTFSRGADSSIPLAETVGVLGELIAEGKIRHFGVSNETAWGVGEHIRVAAAHDGVRPVTIQNAYNLLTRGFETALAEYAYREGVGLMAYSPLAQGFLTGKYAGGAMPAGSRKSLFGDRMGRYETPSASSAIDRYVAIAAEAGLDPARMALAFVTSRPFVTANIIGATSVEQLRSDIAGAASRLPADALKRIEEVHLAAPSPCS